MSRAYRVIILLLQMMPIAAYVGLREVGVEVPLRVDLGLPGYIVYYILILAMVGIELYHYRVLFSGTSYRTVQWYLSFPMFYNALILGGRLECVLVSVIPLALHLYLWYKTAQQGEGASAEKWFSGRYHRIILGDIAFACGIWYDFQYHAQMAAKLL